MYRACHLLGAQSGAWIAECLSSCYNPSPAYRNSRQWLLSGADKQQANSWYQQHWRLTRYMSRESSHIFRQSELLFCQKWSFPAEVFCLVSYNEQEILLNKNQKIIWLQRKNDPLLKDYDPNPSPSLWYASAHQDCSGYSRSIHSVVHIVA